MDIETIDKLIAAASLRIKLTPWEDTALQALKQRRKKFGANMTLTPWQQLMLEKLENV